MKGGNFKSFENAKTNFLHWDFPALIGGGM